MKKSLFTLLILALTVSAQAIVPEKVKPVKNIILLVSDGTSLATVSAARWLQFYRNPNQPKLCLDPWLCGTVRTNNSDAPIGDSAPTTSCYVTGHSSKAGYVSTYPPYRGSANLEYIDSTKAYTPMATILEAAKQLQNKATGLVFTCRLPHATPADCSAHHYGRWEYEMLTEQQVHNNLDVVIGGGNAYVNARRENYLKANGWSVIRNDINAMKNEKNNKMWALFADYEMDYDIDRDPAKEPSLAEMAQVAINKLSQDKDGFFLLIEGSKVDMAAHANDPAALPNEFIAFDKACGVAFDFAQKDGNTAVIVVADHGNSGFSIGCSRLSDYGNAPLEKLFGQVAKYKLSGDGLEEKLNSQPFDSLKSIFKKYADIELSKDEVMLLMNCKGYKQSPIPEDMRQPDKASPLYSSYLSGIITKILTAHTWFGWTSGGHTAEDVFLACYNPNNQPPMGMNTNVELAHYIQALFGMYGKMDKFTDTIFAPHKEVFKGYNCQTIKSEEKNVWPKLQVSNPANGKSILISANTNIVEVTDKAGKSPRTVQIPSVMTYVDKNDMFYLPRNLTTYLK